MPNTGAWCISSSDERYQHFFPNSKTVRASLLMTAVCGVKVKERRRMDSFKEERPIVAQCPICAKA